MGTGIRRPPRRSGRPTGRNGPLGQAKKIRDQQILTETPAEIPEYVIRNCNVDVGEIRAILGCGAVVMAVVCGARYALDAATGTFHFCGGLPALATGAIALDFYRLRRDRQPKLVIGRNGIQDMRVSPPKNYALDHIDDLEIEIIQPRARGGVCLHVSLLDENGKQQAIMIETSHLDRGPEEIAELIREVWKAIRAREPAESKGARRERQVRKPKHPWHPDYGSNEADNDDGPPPSRRHHW